MSSLEIPLWWDREVDRNGQPIRLDVRAAAATVWTTSCRKAQSQLGDCSQAAELMESAVAQVSHYLDRKTIPLFSRELEGLVTHSFQRAVRRSLKKHTHAVSMDDPGQQASRSIDRTWIQQVHSDLEYREIVALLNKRSQTILALRYAGYTWKETSQIIGDSVTALRSSFWRDVTRMRSDLAKQSSLPSGKKPQTGTPLRLP